MTQPAPIYCLIMHSWRADYAASYTRTSSLSVRERSNTVQSGTYFVTVSVAALVSSEAIVLVNLARYLKPLANSTPVVV